MKFAPKEIIEHKIVKIVIVGDKDLLKIHVNEAKQCIRIKAKLGDKSIDTMVRFGK